MSRARAPAALLTGAAGQLGRALQATAPETWRVIACDAAALDVTRPEAVEEVCLLYTSDAADDGESVDLGGRRIIKKIFF